jgi:divalent metal cation (Fe/Co/Zn/Cd) transporter
MTGKRLDISAHVFLDSSLTFEDVHRIVSIIERAIRSKVQRMARITIQTAPVGHGRRDVAALVAQVADHVPGSRGVHNIHIQKIAGKWCVDLRLEVSANISVKTGHEIAKEVEKKIKASDVNISEVTVHVESASEVLSRELEGRGTELRWYIEHVAKRFPEIKSLHGIKIRRNGNAVNVVLRCGFAPGMSIKHAHEISSKLESTIRSAYPIVSELEIQEEPV